MALSTTETIGFADQFIQLIQDNKGLLQEKGLDVSSWISNETELKNTAVAETAKQDDMEAAAKAQTRVAQTAVKTLYDTTSTRLDAVMGVLGKSTPLAKQASRLRSSLIKQSKNKKNGNNNTPNGENQN